MTIINPESPIYSKLADIAWSVSPGYTPTPTTTPQQTLDFLHNPLGMIDSLMGIPSNAIGSLTTQIRTIIPENINLGLCGALISTGQISCQQQQQSPGATATTAQVQEKPIIITVTSPGTAVGSPGATTSAPTTIAPMLDLSGLFTLFSSYMSKSPGAQQTPPKSILDQLGGMGTILIVGAVAVIGIFLFTSKK